MALEMVVPGEGDPGGRGLQGLREWGLDSG